MGQWRAGWLIASGILLGWLLVAGGLWAASNFSTQDVLNRVLDDTFRGLRLAPVVPVSGMLHNAATSTGVSSAVRVDGFNKKSVQVEFTGTAVVQLEWRLASGTFIPVLGCDGMATPGDKCDLVGNPAYELRANITTCDGCTVTTRYHLEP